jgi:hypothetical protein
MTKYPLIRGCWHAVNLLLIISLAAVLYSFAWEFSTRSYLRGFSDAIIPSTDSSDQKVEAILAWMSHGPARRSVPDPNGLDLRDPEETLNVQQLLDVCGTATNAFVNLAQISGLQARRLLLVDEHGQSKHVVVEVLIDHRWIVVDPAYHTELHLPDGRTLTRYELKNPSIFQAATQSIPGYLPEYTYQTTVHVRVRRVPIIGRYLRRTLNFIWPPWEEAINWTLLLERESFAMLVASILLLCFSLVARLLLGWYCSRLLGIERVRIRDQIVQVSRVLAGNTP